MLVRGSWCLAVLYLVYANFKDRSQKLGRKQDSKYTVRILYPILHFHRSYTRDCSDLIDKVKLNDVDLH